MAEKSNLSYHCPNCIKGFRQHGIQSRHGLQSTQSFSNIHGRTLSSVSVSFMFGPNYIAYSQVTSNYCTYLNVYTQNIVKILYQSSALG